MWQLDGHRGELNFGGWNYKVDLDHAQEGVSLHSKETPNESPRVFRIKAGEGGASHCAEAYTRTTDLIALYPSSPEHRFGYSAYYRQGSSQGPLASSMELWVSVETLLLDSQPSVDVGFEWPGVRWTHWDANLEGELLAPPTEIKQWVEDDAPPMPSSAGARLPAILIAYRPNGLIAAAIMVHPRDQMQTSTRIDLTAPIPCTLKLFSEFMEKGVIRRARLLLVLPTSKATIAHFRQAYQSFAEDELPLTT